MKLRMYAIFSTLAEMYYQEGTFLFNTDAHAKSILSERVGEKEKTTTRIVRVGEFDIITGEVTPLSPVVIPYETGAPVDSLPVSQSPISHDSPSVQESKFLEKTADIKVSR